MDSTLTDPLVGTVLDGRYRLGARIARGGMATVYEGVDERLARTVAVKVMHPGLADDPAFLARFTREARAAARLSSPHVVSVFDQGSDDGVAYLVMELVPGRTLRDLLAERGRLSPALAVSVLEPVLMALSAAHRAGLVHRDVKPENVLVGEDGSVKVADFGLARAVEASSQTATRGVLIGTVAYLAPEQVATGAADERTDVYAAGVMLFEMLTGVPPYSGDTALSVAYQHVHSDVPPPSTLVPVPPALDEITVSATRREPGARPADAGAFLAELRDVRTDLDLPTVALPTVADEKTLAVAVPAPDDKTIAVPLDDKTIAVPLEEQPPVEAAEAAGPAEPRRARHRRRSRRLLVVLVALLVCLGAATTGWWFAAGRYTRTPSFYELSQKQAAARAEQAGLHVKYRDQRVYSETVPKNAVTGQDPSATDRIRRGGTVTLTLSRGPERFTIPALSGKPEDEAVAALKKLHLQPDVKRDYSESVEEGKVVSISPQAGKSVARNTVVTMVVSKGPPPVDVPKVVGGSVDDAQAALAKVGLTADIAQEYDDEAPRGTVMAQDPASGQLPKGSAVHLTVSKGPHLYAVPDVTRMSVHDARETLEKAGFSVRVLGGSHRVVQQIPGAGSKERKGTTITLLALF